LVVNRNKDIKHMENEKPVLDYGSRTLTIPAARAMYDDVVQAEAKSCISTSRKWPCGPGGKIGFEMQRKGSPLLMTDSGPRTKQDPQKKPTRISAKTSIEGAHQVIGGLGHGNRTHPTQMIADKNLGAANKNGAAVTENSEVDA
jgi:hypothetical protein